MAKVLIIAGGDISKKLPFVKTQSTCPALVPLNTRALASYVIEFYRGNHEVHLFVDQIFYNEVTAELHPQRYGYQLHGIDRGLGVVDTLEQALQVVAADSTVIVNLVTTIPVTEPALGEVQGGRLPVHSNTAWSALSIDPTNRIHFHAKGTDRPDDSLAFTGVFHLPADVVKKSIENLDCRTDLLRVVEEASRATTLTLKEVEWIDCGHETNYYRSRAALINSRSFNRLRVDTCRGTITKSSTDHEKLAREVAYYNTLPTDLRILFPRLVAVSGADGHVDSYEMEYYGYPNMAEYLLYWNLSKDNWWRFFDSLNSTCDLFRKHSSSIGPTAYHHFHWKKTIDRIDFYLANLPDPRLRYTLENESIIINGQKIAPLSEMLELAQKIITNAYRESEFSTVHGDLCFNNILYDVASGVIRLIDPRGSFGSSIGTIGDRRYDLAKLAHSSVGHYDYIVNGHFQVSQTARKEWNLAIGLRANASWLEEMTHWFIREQNANVREIHVMTALLFLSMCPLHADDAQRQLAFFLRGMSLLHQSLL